MYPGEKLITQKKLKHYHIPTHAHELTFSCCHRQPSIENPDVVRYSY